MTEPTARPVFPVRPPAPGPAAVLDLPRLWTDVAAEMVARNMTHPDGTPELKQLADLTGLDRNTLGRIRKRGEAGGVTPGQRGGINVNAALTLISFVGHTLADYGMWVRPAAISAIIGDPADEPTPPHVDHLPEE